VSGHPAPILVEASKGADLLVVGSRGHGEFVGMLLGSVSEHCAMNAHCPVLVHRSTS
jgi:nucleotide-binding universal stress UspA family protein